MPDKCKFDHRMPNGREMLIYLYCILNEGDWDKTLSMIKEKTALEDDNPTIVKKVAEYEGKHECITLLDEEYPQSIKQGYKPPFVLVDKKFPNEGDIEEIKVEYGHTEDEYETKYGKLHEIGNLSDFEPSELFDGSIEPNGCMTYWCINGRLYETLE